MAKPPGATATIRRSELYQALEMSFAVMESGTRSMARGSALSPGTCRLFRRFPHRIEENHHDQICIVERRIADAACDGCDRAHAVRADQAAGRYRHGQCRRQ